MVAFAFSLQLRGLRGGYTYELAFRQFEVSETCVFDRPQAGRMWFEGVIRDHLDIGRPEQVALIFDRRSPDELPEAFAPESSDGEWIRSSVVTTNRLASNNISKTAALCGPKP